MRRLLPYYQRRAGWRWNVANHLRALGEFIHFSVYERTLDLADRIAPGAPTYLPKKRSD